MEGVCVCVCVWVCGCASRGMAIFECLPSLIVHPHGPLSFSAYRPNFEFLAKYLIHSLDSGDFSVSAKKKINAKKIK